jgi:hypothetical protein
MICRCVFAGLKNKHRRHKTCDVLLAFVLTKKASARGRSPTVREGLISLRQRTGQAVKGAQSGSKLISVVTKYSTLTAEVAKFCAKVAEESFFVLLCEFPSRPLR